MRMIDADKLIDDYNKSEGTISDLMELILDAAEEALPPNDPLTPEQLRYMSGEPVWITGEKFHPRWDLIRRTTISGMSTYTLGFLAWRDLGRTWLPYRRCK